MRLSVSSSVLKNLFQKFFSSNVKDTDENTVLVQPANHRKEVLWLSLTTLLIVVVWALLVAGRQRTLDTRSLKPWQISAIQDLNTVEQAVYSELRAASTEITAFYEEEGRWPDVQELEALYIPPFADDLSLNTRPPIQWLRIQDSQLPHSPGNPAFSKEHLIEEGARVTLVAYAGNSSASDKALHFLLFLTADPLGEFDETALLDATPEIWVNAQERFALPDQLVPEPSLAEFGFQEAAAHDGGHERKRLKEGAK